MARMRQLCSTCCSHASKPAARLARCKRNTTRSATALSLGWLVSAMSHEFGNLIGWSRQ